MAWQENSLRKKKAFEACLDSSLRTGQVSQGLKLADLSISLWYCRFYWSPWYMNATAVMSLFDGWCSWGREVWNAQTWSPRQPGLKPAVLQEQIVWRWIFKLLQAIVSNDIKHMGIDLTESVQDCMVRAKVHYLNVKGGLRNGGIHCYHKWKSSMFDNFSPQMIYTLGQYGLKSQQRGVCMCVFMCICLYVYQICAFVCMVICILVYMCSDTSLYMYISTCVYITYSICVCVYIICVYVY